MKPTKLNWIIMRPTEFLVIKIATKPGGFNDNDIFKKYMYMDYPGVSWSTFINIILSTTIKDVENKRNNEIVFCIEEWFELKTILNKILLWFDNEDIFIYEENNLKEVDKKKVLYMMTKLTQHLAFTPCIIKDRYTGKTFEGINIHLKGVGVFISLTKTELCKLIESLKLVFNNSVSTTNSMINTMLLLKILNKLEGGK